MPSTTRFTSWPTLDRINTILSALHESDEKVEFVVIDLYGTIDQDDPHENPRIAPTTENVAALTALVDVLDNEIGSLEGWRDDVIKYRDTGAFHLLHGTKPANA